MIICSPVTGVNPKVSAIIGGTVTDIVSADLRFTTNISEGAFAGNDSLNSVVIPENVTTIHQKAFTDCNALSRIILKGDAVKALANVNALDGTLLQSYTTHNVAPISTYRFVQGTTVYSTAECNYGDPYPYDWETYDTTGIAIPKHYCKLNDGIIYRSGDRYGYGRFSTEFYKADANGNVTSGYTYLWFKLPQKMTVTQVSVWFNNSTSVGRSGRGFPALANYSVWVTNDGENIYNNHGKLRNTTISTSHSYGSDFREYISSGRTINNDGSDGASNSGQYIFIQMNIPNTGVSAYGIAEVQIWVEKQELPNNISGIFIDSNDPDMVNKYKTATNWNAYSEIIKPITELGA